MCKKHKEWKRVKVAFSWSFSLLTLPLPRQLINSSWVTLLHPGPAWAWRVDLKIKQLRKYLWKKLQPTALTSTKGSQGLRSSPTNQGRKEGGGGSPDMTRCQARKVKTWQCFSKVIMVWISPLKEDKVKLVLEKNLCQPTQRITQEFTGNRHNALQSQYKMISY